jgi:alpha-mannosidase
MPEREQQTPIMVHMVGNAHIDPIWLWPMSEGREEVSSSYRTALMLIKEFDGYVFTSGGASTYEWVQQDDPAMFRSIQRAVLEGRWVLVNGWWLQPDCNIPHGESFARHALYGQRYLMRHFQRRARVGYNVDSFGHAGTLPQLLKLSGLDSYVFFRPGRSEKELPQGPFWWQAPGGARVLACRPPLHYGTGADTDMAERIEAAAEAALPGFPVVMCFYGVGNHGGGPTRKMVRQIRAYAEQETDIEPLFSSPEAFFQKAYEAPLDWPVVRDELQHHSRGCYTALSRVKTENRRAEHALMLAERLGALATVMCGTPDTRDAIRVAWQGVLFNQFHDILAGTSIRDAYEDVWDLYDVAMRTATTVRDQALDDLSARVDVPDRGEAHPVLVWNPSAWPRDEVVRLSIPMSYWRSDFAGRNYPDQVTVEDASGRALPSQIANVRFDYATYMIDLDVRLTAPALGAERVYVIMTRKDPPEQEPAPVHANVLENGTLRVEVDPETGWIISLRDLEEDEELLSRPANVGLVIDDPSDTWSHDVEAFRDVIGRFRAAEPPELIADGPVAQVLRVHSAWGDSTMVQDITLYKDEGPDGRVIDVAMSVDWHEQLKMLKLAFPLALGEASVTASAPYGWEIRDADGNEEPCQAWVDVSGKGEGRPWGLCLINDSKYGYDALQTDEGAELRLSVLRSPIYAFHRPREIQPGVDYPYTDQGQQIVRYRLILHRGTWDEANPDRAADALQQPLIPRQVESHEGDWQPGALLQVQPDNIVLTVVKLGEDDGRLLVRGYETEGVSTEMTLSLPLLGHTWTHSLAPHEIWTLALPLDGGAPQPLNLLEEPLHP